jgi:hypothetical protein
MPEGLSDAQLIERLERVERNLRRLAERVGVELEDPAAGLDAEVVELARSGARMGAAKLYADPAGIDFVEAQRVVNSL